MKAVILINPYLTEAEEMYQPRRIAEELEARGVEVRIFPNVRTARVGGTGNVDICCDFCVYLDKDKYVPRILEARGTRLFNRAEAVEICDDKMLTHIALDGVVPMPETIAAPLCYKSGAEVWFDDSLGYPVVVKECYGSFGKQVYLARNEGELRAVLKNLQYKPHLLQKFISESAGRDLRLICVGGETVAAMERRSDGDFRSNIGLGGHGTPYEADGRAREIGRTVSNALHLDYCGIDLLFGKDGYLLCEVNSNAFFGGIERTTGVNVAGKFADHMLAEMRRS